MSEMVTITKEEYDRLQAANELLCVVMDNHDLHQNYEEVYPDLYRGAGFESFDEDDEEARIK